MSKKLFVICSVFVALLLTVSPVMAITFGKEDGNHHPYVGVVIFTADEVGYYQCSGTLISPTVFLTAGHCAVDAKYAWVSFDEIPDYQTWRTTWITGHGIPHPNYDGFATFPNISDVGVILLDTAVTWITPATLAPLGFLDTYANKKGQQEVIFNGVGYGVNSYKPYFVWDGNRYYSEQRIINLTNANTAGYNVMFSNNPGKGNGVGGTCSGDSGGPFLWGGTNMVVAINSFGIAPWCKGNDYAYRVDIQNTYDFLDDFIDLDD